MKLAAAIAATLVAYAAAECPNGCSGHGSCNTDEHCICHKEGKIINPRGNSDTKERAWTGADCSLMRCPRGISWVKVSDSKEVGKDVYCKHKTNIECSDKGLCNRQTGQCACFPGYTGAACQRTSCPNDCSGHGICQSNIKFAEDATIAMQPSMWARYGSNAEYNYLISYDEAWDSGLHFGCKCDIGYRGPDCSLIECPSDNDPLDDYCLDDAAKVIEFIGEEHYYGTIDGKLHPQMAPLPNKLLLYVENYVQLSLYRSQSVTMGSPGYDNRDMFTTYTDLCSKNHIKGESITASTVTTNIAYPYFMDSAGKAVSHTASGTASMANCASDPYSCYADTVAKPWKRCVAGLYCGGRTMGQPCSGRGLCNYGDGTCTCHTGYSGAACEAVEALA